MIDFNTDPYFDDFSESKEFYRILFRPGYAVQARELTQIQTLLQNQITKFGNHVFKDGSLVLGGDISTAPANYILLTDDSVTDFEGTFIEGATSGAKARVIKTVNDATASKIYFVYTNGIEFVKGETVNDSTSTYSATIVNETTFSGLATSFSISESVFYVKGHFVFCNAQTAIVGDTTTPSVRVGLLATESIITSNDDSTLLDPARGSYNFSAPGADRYSISLDLTSYAYTQSNDAEDNASEDFIELARYISGTLTSINNLPSYATLEDTLARRTYDESGHYTVKPFGLKVENHIFGDNTKYTLSVEPGKAYVQGYEFETIARTPIDIPKSTTTNFNNEKIINVDFGNYILIENPLGYVDYAGNQTVNVYSSNTYASANLIGTARVKQAVYDSKDTSTDPDTYIYKLYFDNLSLGSNTIASIRGFATGNATGANLKANVRVASYTDGVVDVTTNTKSAYIVKLPKDYVSNVDYVETSYRSQTTGTGSFATNSTNATATITILASQGNYISGLDDEDYILTVSSVTSGSIPVGMRLDPASYTVTRDSDQQITVLYTGSYAGNSNFDVNMLAPVAWSGKAFKTKTLATGTLSTTAAAVANITGTATLSLNKSDIFELTSVVITDDTSATYKYVNSYTLNTGQTDSEYGHGYVTLKDGYIAPTQDLIAKGFVAGLANITSVVFTFNYFTHSGEGPFTVDSYSSSGIEYKDIPTYTSSTGEVFDLRNCFDFRPRRADGGSTYTTGGFPTPDQSITTDFYNYLGRKDRLVITKDRKINLVQGIPSETPSYPLGSVDAMTLYLIDVAPYTRTKDEITFSYIDNRRYTMRDIGRIDKRVEKLEYYTALSLLEKQAKDENIINETTLIDRFKNGILVDSFTGHSVGDVANPDYSCSIDYENRILRPRAPSQSYGLKYTSNANAVVRGDLVTLAYTTETLVGQPLASSTVNLNPYFVFNWNGIVTLDPATDNWVDTSVKPDVTVNLNGENDIFTKVVQNITNPASVGTKFNDWQTVIKGLPVVQNQLSTSTAVNNKTQADGSTLQTTVTTTTNNQTTTVKDTLERTGIQISTGQTQTITRDLGYKVVDSSIVPYIRPRQVNFAARSLKPKTQLFAYFDGVDVSDYCAPAVEITIDGTIPSAANKITDGSTTGTIILKRPDRIFARLSGGLVTSGNTITFLADTTSLGTASANVISYSTDTGTVSGNVILQTNEYGDIAGTFNIPSNDQVRFRTGERTFRLADNSGEKATTAAAVKYVAQGLSQSIEKTIVATRVAAVSINPVEESKVVTSVVRNTVTTQTSNAIIIAPPAPPAANCGAIFNGGNQGQHTFTIDLGTTTGNCGINYNAFSVPDRYTIIWDGNQYTTGFVGSSTYDSKLNALGYPSTAGTGSGQLRFNKSKASPRTATVVVDAPLQGTGWRFQVVCPGVTNNSNVAPSANLTLSASISGPATLARATSGSILDFKSTISCVRSDKNDNTFKKYYWTLFALRADGTVVDLESTSKTTLYPSVVVDYSQAELAAAELVSGKLSALYLAAKVEEHSSSSYSSVLRTAIPVPKATGGNSTLQTKVATLKSAGYEIGLVTTIPAQPVVQKRIDPVAQTFFVDAEQYPNGIFLDSLDLYFKSKSDTIPVQVQIRPTVNGYPSSKDVLPFGFCELLPSQVSVSTDASLATNFKFPSPVYLAPGEYSFVALTNTTEYQIYTAVIGDFLLTNTNIRITQQPAVGSMFKSQNASTWTPVQEEDVMFKLNKCVFPTTGAATVTLNADISSTDGDADFDLFYASGEVIDFGSTTDLSFEYKTRTTGGTTGSFTSYQLGSNAAQSSRMRVRSTNPEDLQVRATLSTTDANISPVIDINRLSTVLVQNVVNNDFTNESNYAGGNAVAKYITRKVTLAPGFESLDLKAYLLASIPTNTSIKVYYKVAPVTDSIFEDNGWTLMSLESSGTYVEGGWVEYKYKTASNQALTTGDRFKTFALKIVMLSSDTTRVPQIRDLRVIALDD